VTNLATKKNKFRRNLELNSTCSICGREEEDSFHATVNCTMARALRWEMRKHWDLPPERNFSNTGPDWLQQLFGTCETRQRSRILMTLWRAWHLRCDITHGKGEETIARSVAFLLSYDRELQISRDPNTTPDGNSYYFMSCGTNQACFQTLRTGTKRQSRTSGKNPKKDT
jgi:hypothetical protein